MHNTFKGIYIKSRPGHNDADTGEISNVLYENIVIDNPTQWAIWIGEAMTSVPPSDLMNINIIIRTPTGYL